VSGNKDGLPRQSTASGAKRQKELARLKLERQVVRRHARSQRAKRRGRIVAAVTSVAIVLAAVTYLLWPSRAKTASPNPSVSATPSASPTPKASWAISAPVSCVTPPALRTDKLSWTKAPGSTVKATDKPVLTLTTNCGVIKIDLLASAAPKTVSSMLFLAKQGYFDRTKCHRLTTAGIYVVQCGDPTATGSGGPGYSVADENLPKGTGVNYPAGTVAMANSGPNTNGSQFFIVFANTTLGPNYTIWGHVVSGLDIAKYVANQGVAGGASDGAPMQPLVISKALGS
jgi:peptidyl-prolyl cis-trans isomerase B (cyclophilin B)